MTNIGTTIKNRYNYSNNIIAGKYDRSTNQHISDVYKSDNGVLFYRVKTATSTTVAGTSTQGTTTQGTTTQGTTTAVKSGDISVAPVIAFFMLGSFGILAFKRKNAMAGK